MVRGAIGTIYLLHFEREVLGTQHYIGWASDLDRRIRDHRTGYKGSELTNAAHRAGIDFVVARTWQGNKYKEGRLDRTGGGGRWLCPLCVPMALART
jgi:hypothetical protein